MDARDARFVLQLDAVERLRAQGGVRDPDTVAVAVLAQVAGAQKLSISARDVRGRGLPTELRGLCEVARVPLDVRLTPGADLASVAFDIRPRRVTLVGERRDAERSAASLDVQVLREALRKPLQALRDAEVEVACFVEPDLDQVKAVHKLDADMVVLDTHAFATARSRRDREAELTRVSDAAHLAARLGLSVAASGALDLLSAEEVAGCAAVDEVQVGAACIAHAVLVGIERAVRDFAVALERGRRRPR